MPLLSLLHALAWPHSRCSPPNASPKSPSHGFRTAVPLLLLFPSRCFFFTPAKLLPLPCLFTLHRSISLALTTPRLCLASASKTLSLSLSTHIPCPLSWRLPRRHRNDRKELQRSIYLRQLMQQLPADHGKLTRKLATICCALRGLQRPRWSRKTKFMFLRVFCKASNAGDKHNK